MNTNPYATARAATTLTGLAVLSPLAGIAVEMSLAWRFGTSPTVDAYRIGTVFLLMGQQLLVLQILPHILVPVFTDQRACAGEQKAWQVAFHLGNVFLGGAVLFALLAFLRPEPLLWLFASGLKGAARETALVFLRWFALAYVPLVLSGLATSLLYVHEIFWLPSFAQLVGNFVMAAVILLSAGLSALTVLVGGALLGAVLSTGLHAVWLAPLMRHARAHVPWGFSTRDPAVRRGLGLAVPLLGAFVLGQWAPIVVNRVMSGLPPGNLAMFGYAFKMGLLVSLAPVALATVLFPRFAQGRFTGEAGEFRTLRTRALRMGLFLAMPLTACAVMLRHPLVALLFERGAFSPKATQVVGDLFGLLVMGAPAAVATVYLEKVLYALEKAWLPTCVRCGSMLLLTALAPFAAARLQASGIALLLTLLTWGTALALFLTLQQRQAVFAFKEIGLFATQMVLLAGVGAWIGGGLGRWLGRASELPLVSAGLACAGGFVLGGTLFFVAALALRFPEAVECSQFLRWQGSALLKWVQGTARG